MAEVLSVVITTLCGGPRLTRCLEALAGQERHPDEIIVSFARTPASVPEGVRVVTAPRPTHHARTANAGLALARGDLIVVLNDDTVAGPGFLAALRAAVDAHGSGLYQPRILLPDGRVENIGHDLFPDGFNRARGRGRCDDPTLAAPGTVGAISGAAFLISRSVLDAIGPYDASFEAFGEDVDLSLRALRRGIPLRYVPDAVVAHELGASYGRHGMRKIFLVERNRVRLAARSLPVCALVTGPAWTTLRWAALTLGAITGTGVAGGVPPVRTGIAALAGTLAGVAHLPDAFAKRTLDTPEWAVGETGMVRTLWRERIRIRRRSSPRLP